MLFKSDIKIPIYECTCRILISDDIEKVINRYVKIKKWGKEVSVIDYKVHGYTVTGKDNDYYIFFDPKSLTINCISHEISHLVDYILSERDIEDEGEAKAYLTGFITEKIFDFILKRGLLVNKWFKTPLIITENQKISDEKPSGLFRENNQALEGIEEGPSRCGDQ